MGLGPGGSVVVGGGLSWTRVRSPQILSQIAKALVAIGGLAYLDSAFFGVLATMSAVLAVLLFVTSYILSLTQTAFPGSLEIHADHLGVQSNARRVVIINRKIRSAMVVERPGFAAATPTVEIEFVNGDVLVARLPDPGSARAVVEALGFGVGGARVHAALAKPTRRLLHPLAGVGSYVISAWALLLAIARVHAAGYDDTWVGSCVFLLYPALALALYAVARRLMRSPDITVGDDGVLLRGRLGSRFIARRDIAFVGAAAGTPLFMETRAGERIHVGGLLLDDARRGAIARIIEERAGPSVAGADRFAHYERGGRALPEWRAHLAHAMNEATYRANAATVEEATGVLRSGQSTPEQRIGAALALRVADQPRELIRVAGDAAVDERMREALEAVAESDDDQAIERALLRLPRAPPRVLTPKA